MSNLKEKMQNQKLNIDMGRFEDFPYEQLVSMVNPYSFYFNIHTPQEVLQFLQAVHVKYSKQNSHDYVPLSYKKQEPQTMGFTQFGKNPQIAINSSLSDIFSFMKASGNKYFPFYLYEIIIHESNHIFQIEAVNENKFSFLDNENRIGALYQRLMVEIEKQYVADKLSKDNTKNKTLSNFFDIDDLVLDIKERREEPFFYGNEPCEIAARDNTCRECSKLLNILDLPLEHQILFKTYLLEQARASVYLAYDEKHTNKNFFWGLIKAELLDEFSNVKRARIDLCEEIDKVFASQGLKTLESVESDFYAEAEQLTKRLLVRARLVSKRFDDKEKSESLSIESEKLAAAYDKMIDKLFLKRAQNYMNISSQYFDLFPILKQQHQLALRPRIREELLGDKNVVESLVGDSHFVIKEKKR